MTIQDQLNAAMEQHKALGGKVWEMELLTGNAEAEIVKAMCALHDRIDEIVDSIGGDRPLDAKKTLITEMVTEATMHLARALSCTQGFQEVYRVAPKMFPKEPRRMNTQLEGKFDLATELTANVWELNDEVMNHLRRPLHRVGHPRRLRRRVLPKGTRPRFFRRLAAIPVVAGPTPGTRATSFRFFCSCSGAWTRTTIQGFKVPCPAIRRHPKNLRAGSVPNERIRQQ